MFKWIKEKYNETTKNMEPRYIDVPQLENDTTTTLKLSGQDDFRFHCYVDEENFNILKKATKEYAEGYVKNIKPDNAIYHVEIPIKVVDVRNGIVIINIKEYYYNNYGYFMVDKLVEEPK